VVNHNTETEIWKDIEGYVGFYQVSNFGRVKSVERESWNGKSFFLKEERILKATPNHNGYPSVALCKNSKYKRLLVHRLVAKHFVENPNSHPIVNHKDEVKTNNHVANLEWCTYKYNLDYSSVNKKVALHPNYIESRKKVSILLSKKVKGINIKTGEIVYFKSALSAEKSGFSSSHISKVCNGKRNSHKGYKWEYIKEFNEL
jgi:hypothetical protein